MKDVPNPFWALLFLVLAVGLAVVALLRPAIPTVTIAVITIASNIVSGSFGYISGHKDGATSVSVPTQPSPGAAMTVSVGATSEPAKNPTPPADPA